MSEQEAGFDRYATPIRTPYAVGFLEQEEDLRLTAGLDANPEQLLINAGQAVVFASPDPSRGSIFRAPTRSAR